MTLGREPIHTRLRNGTAELHRSLEMRLNFLGPELSKPRYRGVLEMFHGYYASLEPQLVELAVRERVDLPLRRRLPLLKRDLTSLGLSTEEIDRLPVCGAIPLVTRREHLAGCLYVIEGSCLGGQLITRAVQKALGLTPDGGVAFFHGDGQGTGSRWRAVLRWLDKEAEVLNGELIVHSACATFETMGAWAELQGACR